MKLKILNYKKIPIFRLVCEDNVDNYKTGISLFTVAWYKSTGCIKTSSMWPNSVIIANSEEEYEYYNENSEANVVFANQNAFLNEERYKIVEILIKNTIW